MGLRPAQWGCFVCFVWCCVLSCEVLVVRVFYLFICLCSNSNNKKCQKKPSRSHSHTASRSFFFQLGRGVERCGAFGLCEPRGISGFPHRAFSPTFCQPCPALAPPRVTSLPRIGRLGTTSPRQFPGGGVRVGSSHSCNSGFRKGGVPPPNTPLKLPTWTSEFPISECNRNAPFRAGPATAHS